MNYNLINGTMCFGQKRQDVEYIGWCCPAWDFWNVQDRAIPRLHYDDIQDQIEGCTLQ